MTPPPIPADGHLLTYFLLYATPQQLSAADQAYRSAAGSVPAYEGQYKLPANRLVIERRSAWDAFVPFLEYVHNWGHGIPIELLSAKDYNRLGRDAI